MVLIQDFASGREHDALRCVINTHNHGHLFDLHSTGNKKKKKKIQACGNHSKSNRIMVITEKKVIPLTLIKNDHSLSWLGRHTSTTNCRVKLVTDLNLPS